MEGGIAEEQRSPKVTMEVSGALTRPEEAECCLRVNATTNSQDQVNTRIGFKVWEYAQTIMVNDGTPMRSVRRNLSSQQQKTEP